MKSTVLRGFPYCSRGTSQLGKTTFAIGLFLTCHHIYYITRKVFRLIISKLGRLLNIICFDYHLNYYKNCAYNGFNVIYSKINGWPDFYFILGSHRLVISKLPF